MQTQEPITLHLPDIWQLPIDTEAEKKHKKDLMIKWLACKQLSHAWQMEGNIDLPNRYRIDLTGMNLFNFKYLVRHGLTGFSNTHCDLLPKEDASHLCTLIADKESSYLEQDAALLYADFQKGSPICVLTGYEGHRAVVSFDGDYLILSNKGGETRKPVELYKIDRKKVDAAVIQQLLDLKSQESENYTKWVKAIEENFGAAKDPLCFCIEQAYPLSSFQQVGNCEWESLQTNVYAALLLHRLKDRFLLEEIKDLIDSTNRTFLELQQFIQLQTLESFFKTFNVQEDGIPFESLDPSFLRSLFVQYWCTQSPSSEFTEKMDGLETRYFQSLDEMTRALRKTEKLYYTQMSRVPYLAKDLAKIWMPTVLATTCSLAFNSAISRYIPLTPLIPIWPLSYFTSQNLQMLTPFYSYSIYYSTQLLRRNFAI